MAAGKAGDYPRAEAAFRTSYALRPSGSTLRNWALAEMHLGKLVEALGHLKIALTAPGLTAEQRTIVQQNFDDAYRATGHLAVRTTEGARIAIDGVVAEGAAPFDRPLDVLPGNRQVEARLTADVAHAEVDAPAGQVVQVNLPVPAEPPGPSSVLVSPTSVNRESVRAPAPGEPSRAMTWWTAPHAGAVGLAAAGAVGLALGGYFEASSNGAAADADSLRSSLGGRCMGPAVAPECTVLRDKIAEVHTDQAIAEVALAAGATAVVGAVVMLALAGPSSMVRTGSVQWTPKIAPGAAGVVGSF
jgi:hypothetical protein